MKSSVQSSVADSERPAPARTWLRRSLLSSIIAVLAAGLGGCVTLGERERAHSASQATAASVLQASLASPAPARTKQPQSAPFDPATAPDIWSRLRHNFQLLPAEHPRIQREISRLQASPHAFNQLLMRAEPYLFHIIERVEKRGMPAEIALLPAVESGFRPFAYSPDGAAGLWQIMPATGRSLGLRQDWWYDGRRDIIASTEAALDYLEKLNRRFDDHWLYALAAYNAGGGTVNRALRKARENQASLAYWDLDLPGETDSYIPRLLALCSIVANPDRYGLQLPHLDNQAQFTQVPTLGQIDLRIAAELAGLSMPELAALNPAFNRWATSPKGPHYLILPLEKAAQFNQKLTALPIEQRLRWREHRIVKGDNLGQLAQTYGVSVKAIQEANKLRGNRIRAGKTLRIPLSQSTTSSEQGRQLKLKRTRLNYQVKHGDSLYRIARKFQVSIADLRRWNSLGRYLQPGQSLTVYVDPVSQTL